MDTHKNARLTPKGREQMVRAVVDFGMSKAAAARQFNTTIKTVTKWIERFRADGVEGLRDRSSRPLSSPSQIPLATADAAESLRRQRCSRNRLRFSSQFPKPAFRVSSIDEVSACSRRWSRSRPVLAMSVPRPARSSTSTSKNSAVSTEPAIALRAMSLATALPDVRDGSSSMWRSTIIPALPWPRSSPTRRRRARSLSWKPLSPTIEAWASPSAVS
jgi:transposase-like protein